MTPFAISFFGMRLRLKGKPENFRSYVKYGVREARLALIERWAKRAMRHFPKTKPHAKKRMRKVSLWKASKKMSVYFELKANPMRPGSKHHDEPILLPFNSSRNCVICKTQLEDIVGALMKILARSSQCVRLVFDPIQCRDAPNSSKYLSLSWAFKTIYQTKHVLVQSKFCQNNYLTNVHKFI